jgi:hypothetical protein
MTTKVNKIEQNFNIIAGEGRSKGLPVPGQPRRGEVVTASSPSGLNRHYVMSKSEFFNALKINYITFL